MDSGFRRGDGRGGDDLLECPNAVGLGPGFRRDDGGRRLRNVTARSAAFAPSSISLPPPSMAQPTGLRNARPVHPWTVVRGRARQWRFCTVFDLTSAAIHGATHRLTERPARPSMDGREPRCGPGVRKQRGSPLRYARHVGQVMRDALVAIDARLLARDQPALVNLRRAGALAGEVHRLVVVAVAALERIVRL